MLCNDAKALSFVKCMPKVELHVHIEGCLSPSVAGMIAKNKSLEGYLWQPEGFSSLNDFLALYYENCRRYLTNKCAFTYLVLEYFKDAAKQNIMHVEIQFDPQTHLDNGLSFTEFFEGLHEGARRGYELYGISFNFIMCILRDKPLEDAMKAIKEAYTYRRLIAAVGLDSCEAGFPCNRFRELFAFCRENYGWKCVAHAGESGPPSNIYDAIRELKVHRIDHGIRVLADPETLDLAKSLQVAFTVCPISNVFTRNIPRLEEHPLQQMLASGVRVTLNSDDPAYLGGNLTRNYEECVIKLRLTNEQAAQTVSCAIDTCFAPEARKELMRQSLKNFIIKNL